LEVGFTEASRFPVFFFLLFFSLSLYIRRQCERLYSVIQQGGISETLQGIIPREKIDISS
jgi:hypothetical protein